MRFPGDNDYLKYYTVHSNSVEQYWCNQKIMIPASLETIDRDIINLYQGLSILYTKFTHLENTSLWWYCPFNIYYTSLSFTMAILIIICSSSSNVTNQISCLLWWEYSYSAWSSIAESYFYQYLTTETSTWSDRGYTTETPSISYNSYLYIRLVVTL